MKLLKIALCSLLAAASFTMALPEDWETWPLEELERQVSPSRWNPHKSPDEVIQEYINDGLQGTKRARESLLCSLNMSYGTGPWEKLDIYGTDLPNNAPIFLWIHGGYWQEGSKDISAGLALNLHTLGIRTVVLGYTLAPNAKIEKMQRELKDALRVIIKQYPFCKIILGGHSAGAQLSASVLYESNDFPEIVDTLSGLVLVSGIYDLRLLVPTSVNTLLGMTPQEAETLSPLIKPVINPNLQNKNIKVLFMYGSLDSPEFQKQSKAYNDVLKNKGLETQSYESNGDDHFTIVQNLANSQSGSGKVLNQFLQPFSGQRTGRNEGNSIVPHALLTVISIFQFLLHIL